MAMTHPLADSRQEGAAWAAGFPWEEEEPAAESDRLRDHLLRDHGRARREIDGLPVTDLHRFEHVEQAMGLNDLNHQHPADGATP